MAAVTLLGAATFDTSTGTHTVTATPAVGDLIVIVCANSGTTTSPTVTDNNSSGTYSEITGASALKNTSADKGFIFVRTAKIPAANSTIFSVTGASSTGGGLVVLKVTGTPYAGLGAIRQAAKVENQAGSSTPTPVFSVAAKTTNPVIGYVFNGTSPATLTPRSSPAYTERADVGYSTPTTGLEVMSIDSGETNTSIAWGSATTVYSAAVVELQLDMTEWLLAGAYQPSLHYRDDWKTV